MESFCNHHVTKLEGDINVQCRKLILNIYKVFNELKEDPDKLKTMDFKQPRKLTALVCGTSITTLDRIRKEVLDTGSPCAPRKDYQGVAPVTNLDDFDKSVIKRIVSSFYANGEYPSVQKVLDAAQEKIPNFKCSLASMGRIMRCLGYRYKKTMDNRRVLLERGDIVCARLDFLRKMDQLRASDDKRPRFYLDETWVNQNHSRKRTWLDNEGKQGGLNAPIGKGARLIICHGGSSKTGFIPEAKLVFRAVKSSNADYHTEMNSAVYMKWFKDFLLLLEEPSIIILDNASYHTKVLNPVPNTNWHKKDIQEWLTKNNIYYPPSAFVEELLRIVGQNKHKKIYEIDQLANEYGHEIIRLPPYHCQYNPIELIWAQVKGEVATKNKTFKMVDVEKIMNDAIDNVTIEDWQKCVRHAEALQNDDLEKAHLADTRRLVINLRDDDNDSDSEYEENNI